MRGAPGFDPLHNQNRGPQTPRDISLGRLAKTILAERTVSGTRKIVAPEKPFLADERNFTAPPVRPTRGDVRGHFGSDKSDRRSSYPSYRRLQQRKQRKTDCRKIFGAAEFSTVSANNRHCCASNRPRTAAS